MLMSSRCELTLVGGDGDVTGTSDLHQLSQDETSRSSTDQEDLGTERHLQLVHSVDSARSGLK